MALTAPGIARAGAGVFRGDRQVGCVTSGTAVPYWRTRRAGEALELTDEHATRSIALALLDSDLAAGQEIEIDIRGRRCAAIIVRRHLRSDARPYAEAILPVSSGDAEQAPEARTRRPRDARGPARTERPGPARRPPKAQT